MLSVHVILESGGGGGGKEGRRGLDNGKLPKHSHV